MSFSLVLFTQELLALLEAGLSVVEALDALLEKERRPHSRNILGQLVRSLQEGKSFSAALDEIRKLLADRDRLYSRAELTIETTGRSLKSSLEELRSKVKP